MRIFSQFGNDDENAKTASPSKLIVAKLSKSTLASSEKYPRSGLFFPTKKFLFSFPIFITS